jgi:hypothetical protein
MVLAAVTMRGYLENEGKGDTPEYHQKMLVWLAKHSVGLEFEPAERKLVGTPIGRLTADQGAAALWRAEGFGVLAWALGYGALPPHDQEVSQHKTAKALGFMKKDGVLDKPALISKGDIERYAATARAIHWRLREATLRNGKVDMVALSAAAPWRGTFELKGVALIDNDLAIAGRAIHRASPGTLSNAASIAEERLVAVNWLIGRAKLYSQIEQK